jgi:hypothetical protein
MNSHPGPNEQWHVKSSLDQTSNVVQELMLDPDRD